MRFLLKNRRKERFEVAGRPFLKGTPAGLDLTRRGVGRIFVNSYFFIRRVKKEVSVYQ